MTRSKLERFRQLTALLSKHQEIWTSPVFKNIKHGFLDQYPSLNNWLDSLSDKQLISLQEDDHQLLSSISPHFEDAQTILSLISFPISQAMSYKCLPKCWENDIPGRKTKQVLAFSQSLVCVDQPILEWCCGKQHLGRFLSEQHQHASTGLEIDATLVEQANHLARKRKVEHLVQTHKSDVFSNHVEQFIHNQQHAIALHACGGLHTRLLNLATKHKLSRISFSPCCYHRFNTFDDYQALSKAGQQSQLQLSIDDLRLAVRETKTASVNETNKRRQLQEWRLGFDCLQRDIRNIDDYLETPSLNNAILKKGFNHFCLLMATQKHITINQNTDFTKYEQLGKTRFFQYERAELVRMVFRRALESWLVLDKALFLEEQGYDTHIALFCSSDISPRNFFIDAHKRFIENGK